MFKYLPLLSNFIIKKINKYLQDYYNNIYIHFSINILKINKEENDDFDIELYNIIHYQYYLYLKKYNYITLTILCNKNTIKWCEKNIKFINVFYIYI